MSERASSRRASGPGRPSPASSESHSEYPHRFAIFCSLWSLVILFHFMAPDVRVTTPTSALLLLLATVALFRPTSSLGLAALCVVQIFDWFEHLPMAQSSYYFTAIGSVALLLSFARVAARNRVIEVRPEAWIDDAAVFLRLMLVFVMAAAVFHKLNADFFDPQMSEVVGMYQPWIRRFGLSDTAFHRAFDLSIPWLTILGEATIGVCLALRSLRTIGILLLLVVWFHIGLMGVAQFSSVLYAALFLHLRSDFGRVMQHRWPPWQGASTGRILLMLRCAVVALALGSVWSTSQWISITAWCLFAAVVGLALGWWHVRVREGVSWQGTFRPIPGAFVLLASLLVLNEAGPYVGYKDWPAFVMFSGVKTGTATNHLLVPASLYVAHDPSDDVTVSLATLSRIMGPEYLDSDQPRPVAISYGSMMAVLARQQRLHQLEDFEIEYLRNGRPVRIGTHAALRGWSKSLGETLLPPRFFWKLFRVR